MILRVCQIKYYICNEVDRLISDTNRLEKRKKEKEKTMYDSDCDNK